MKIQALTTQEIKKHNPRCFVIYSDNILESTNILDLMSDGNRFLEIVGVSYEPIDQPIYLFKEKSNSSYICIKVAGKYENWNLPENVNSIIHFIDKPDFVIIDGADGDGVFFGETTGTANVGNSQWQREGRKISAAEKGIPMIYQTYYSGTDRSMFEQKEIDSGTAPGQVREPTSLQVINHFIYSLRYRTPSLVVYYPNPEYDKIIGFSRENIGRELLQNYIAICLLYKTDKNYKPQKKEIETEIYKRMIVFVTESVNSRKEKILRIEKDFPVEPTRKILATPKFITFLDSIYPTDKGKFAQKLNPKIPTLIIPTLMFQQKGDKYINKVDPGTGEIVAFAELFARYTKNEK